MSARLVVISGCSGGGKSTLLDALQARGCDVVPEVGRRLVREELARGGQALPWTDPTAFLHRMVTASLADLDAAACHTGVIFFDRSLIDALSGLEHRTGEPVLATLGQTHRYHRQVFFAPSWPEIYVMDAERRHDFAAAQAEERRLRRDYPRAGYTLIDLPKLPVDQRANFVLAHSAAK